MKQNHRWIARCAALVCILCAGLAYGAENGNKVKVSGLITGRNGENLTLKTTSGNVVVVLTDTTRVRQPKGLLKVRHSEQTVTALIPGLKIEVTGMGNDTRVVADEIKFDKDDLKLAEVIQAGVDPTAAMAEANQQNIATNKADIATNKEGIAANKATGETNAAGIAANQQNIQQNQQDIAATTKRFSELSEYDTKGTATVYFVSGSRVISAKYKAALSQLAKDAAGMTGYIIQVKGFADSSGNAAMNQALSMDRANAVVAYLLQSCNIPLRHIVAPGAMGVADPAAPNETSSGRAENRRVEVKVLVNRGLAGGM